MRRADVNSLSQKHAEIANRQQKQLEKPRFDGKKLNLAEFKQARYEEEISFQVAERERLLEELNRLRFAGQALLDYLDLYVPVSEVPHKDKYLRLMASLRVAMEKR